MPRKQKVLGTTNAERYGEVAWANVDEWVAYIHQMRDHHNRVVRARVEAGWTNREIAIELGLHEDSVSRIKRRLGLTGNPVLVPSQKKRKRPYKYREKKLTKLFGELRKRPDCAFCGAPKRHWKRYECGRWNCRVMWRAQKARVMDVADDVHSVGP